MLIALIVLPLLFAAGCRFADRRSERARDRLALLGGALELALALMLCFLPDHTLRVFDMPLFALDGFRRVYAVVISFLWCSTIVFSDEYLAASPRRGSYDVFTLLTLGLMMGEFLSASVSCGVLFLALMSFTCYVWMKYDLTPDARRTGRQFLITALIGVFCALVGLGILYVLFGTTELSRLAELVGTEEISWPLSLAGALLLIGFGARAGMFPFHGWLTNASPVPAPGSALLSGVVTKSGIWGVLALGCYLFRHNSVWGAAILSLGVVTMLYGATLALLSVNLKRTLACSSVSQIGFILVGIGMMGLLGEENTLAARGVLLHMVNHSLFKLVLFLCAGTVVLRLHRLHLNEIRGFGREKPLLLISFLLSALGISGIPGTSGYISKTLLHEAIVEGVDKYGAWLTTVEWLFLFAGGMTLAYMTKLFVALFLDRHPTDQAKFDGMRPYLHRRNLLVMALPALGIVLLGCTAHLTMDAIADLGTDFFRSAAPEHPVSYFSPENLKGSLISILIGAALYGLFVRCLLIRGGEYVDLSTLRRRRNEK